MRGLRLWPKAAHLAECDEFDVEGHLSRSLHCVNRSIQATVAEMGLEGGRKPGKRYDAETKLMKCLRRWLLPSAKSDRPKPRHG